jgi:UrcA family protein
LILGLAMLCVGATIPRAFASPISAYVPGHSVKVKYSDLDLNTRKGTEALYNRIQRAARGVCNQDADSSDPMRFSHWHFCYNTAVANAVRDVRNQNLTAMHLQKNKSKTVG